MCVFGEVYVFGEVCMFGKNLFGKDDWIDFVGLIGLIRIFVKS